MGNCCGASVSEVPASGRTHYLFRQLKDGDRVLDRHIDALFTSDSDFAGVRAGFVDVTSKDAQPAEGL